MEHTLEARWDALKANPLCAVFQLCDATHPLDFYLGKNIDEQRLLMLVTPEKPPVIRDMRAIHVRAVMRDDKKWSLLLTLDSTALAPMFSLLCEDLIETSRNTGLATDKSLDIILKRLSDWRRLLDRGLPDLLSENEIRGLCGELLFLRRLFTHLGISDAVKAWVGPQRAHQDFQTPYTAWEIKTIRPDGKTITISSESQLRTTARAIYLAVIELADGLTSTADTFTLNALVDDIRVTLANSFDTSELFEEKLMGSGYIRRPEYSIPLLRELSFRTYAVNDGFPRITAEKLPEGISHVVYDLLLSACEEFRLKTTALTSAKDS